MDMTHSVFGEIVHLDIMEGRGQESWSKCLPLQPPKWCLVHNKCSLLQACENMNKLLADTLSPSHHPWFPSGFPTFCLLF